MTRPPRGVVAPARTPLLCRLGWHRPPRLRPGAPGARGRCARGCAVLYRGVATGPGLLTWERDR